MNFPEPGAQPLAQFTERDSLNGGHRVLGEVGLEMLLTRFTGDNFGREFEECLPVAALISDIERSNRFPRTLCGSVEGCPQERTPVRGVWIRLYRKFTRTRHLFSETGSSGQRKTAGLNRKENGSISCDNFFIISLWNCHDG